MRTLQLKANYKVIQNYYQEINNLAQLSLFSEGTVSPAFAGLLRYCAGQFSWTLAEQYTLKRSDRSIRVDGALLDPFKLLHGVWEAKDTADDLAVEVKKKFDAGYPKDNILFQSPERVILWQHGRQILDEDITRPARLVESLKTDKRSGITNDPNRLDDPQYIVRLIGQVITVSLETVAIVNGLPNSIDDT